MNFSDIQLPSNKKFGAFFSGVFLVVAVWFYFFQQNAVVAGAFAAAAVLFLLLALIKADVLLPLNKLWMRFGLLLGMIVSPIVLGIIFFGLFTPISLVMRLFGRDELRLRFKPEQSHWLTREAASLQAESFKNQF